MPGPECKTRPKSEHAATVEPWARLGYIYAQTSPQAGVSWHSRTLHFISTSSCLLAGKVAPPRVSGGLFILTSMWLCSNTFEEIHTE